MMKYNLQKRWLAAFTFALIGLCASAQSKITGHVYDSAGEPLIGAYVTVEGTKGGSPIAAAVINAIMYIIDNSR